MAALNGHAQTGARTGAISGRVVLEDGQPVDGATVYCGTVEGGSSSRMATTDAEGNFSFTGLAPVAYRIGSFAPGLVSSAGSGIDVPIARIGETHTLTLIKGGVITGRVTNSASEPVVAVQVTAVRVRDPDGRPVRNAPGSRMRQTDDRGIYRLFGLAPGTYLVVANPMSGASGMATAYDQETPTYYPSSNRDGATEISVQTGAEIGGIDIRYREARGHSISGAVEGGSEGGTIDYGIRVELLAAGSANSMATGFARAVGGVRTFVISGVPEGEYDLVARGSAAADESMMSAPRRVVVRGADVTGVKLALSPLGAIAGKVVVDAGTQPAQPVQAAQGAPSAQPPPAEGCAKARDSTMAEIYLRARRDEKGADDDRLDQVMGRSGGGVNEGGEFLLRNLAAGQYRFLADLPGDNWYVKALTVPAAGAARRLIDLGKSPLPIKAGEKVSGVTMTLGESAASMSGKIAGESVKRGRWRLHLVPVEAAQAENTLVYFESLVAVDGSFSIRHIAPGKYWVIARPLAEGEPLDRALKPAVWDGAERAKLRKEAEAAKIEIELQTCQRVKDYTLTLP